MLDLCTIVTAGGIVLWQKQLSAANQQPVSPSIVNGLISDVILGSSASSSSGSGNSDVGAYSRGSYTVRFTTSNDLGGLLFVVVYQSLLRLNFVEELLSNMKRLLTRLCGDDLRSASKETSPPADLPQIVVRCKFEHYFDQRLAELERTEQSTNNHTTSKPPNGTPSAKSPALTPRSPAGTPAVEKSDPLASSSPGRSATPPVAKFASGAGAAARVAGGRRTVANAALRRSGSGRATPASVASSDDEGGVGVVRKGGKTQRRWNADGSVDDTGNDVLDFSSAGAGAAHDTNPDDNAHDINLDDFVGKDAMEETADGQKIIKDLEALLLDDDAEKDKSKQSRGAFSFFSSLVSGKTLTAEDLGPACEKMRQHLLSKNVANEPCTRICDTVRDSLVGQKCGTFERTSKLVESAVASALTRILTPQSSHDLLSEISRVRTAKRQRPFTISFVGVNGVGKSTNLAKVAYWLLGNNLRVLVCACDTFRSGAVEQLRVHVTRLTAFIATNNPAAQAHIQLFEKGYGKDPASIANDAIAYAAKQGFDVVLIDTAGRRHNDARLMQGLERFVGTVNAGDGGIDRIWQVAEALVGTDSVAQARHFNNALGPSRDLDGFIISKIDTVGDLVGTLVSMVHATGAPVVFVGVGQMYTDLRGMSVPWVVSQLMSSSSSGGGK
ncbi:hypothetical protein PYCC9005_004099 [Savitreella phatthalungensis]